MFQGRQNLKELLSRDSDWTSFYLTLKPRISLLVYQRLKLKTFLLLEILVNHEETFSQNRTPHLGTAHIYICKPCSVTGSLAIYAIVVM